MYTKVESLSCTLETKVVLYISYTSTENKNKDEKTKVQNFEGASPALPNKARYETKQFGSRVWNHHQVLILNS